MSLLSSLLVGCCGRVTSSSVSNDRGSLIVGLVGEKKVGCGGRRQVVQWRPSLCTISEEDVEIIHELYHVMPSCKSKKLNTTHNNYNFKPSGKEFVLRDSWAMVSPMPSSFLF